MNLAALSLLLTISSLILLSSPATAKPQPGGTLQKERTRQHESTAQYRGTLQNRDATTAQDTNAEEKIAAGECNRLQGNYPDIELYWLMLAAARQNLLPQEVEGGGKKLEAHHPDLIRYQQEYAEALANQASRLSTKGQQQARQIFSQRATVLTSERHQANINIITTNSG